MAAEPDALRLEAYRRQVAASLAFHRARVDRGLTPACGLRLMTADSATVVPNSGQPGEVPFATFSSDSRETDFYAVACEAAKALIEYAAAPAVQPAAGREEIARAVHDWIRDDASLGLKLQMDRVLADKLTDRILAAISTPAQASGEPWDHAVRLKGEKHWRLASEFAADMAKAIITGDPVYDHFEVQPLYAHPPAQASESGGEALRDALEAVQIIRAFPSNQGEVDGQITAKGHRMLESCCDDIEAALSAPQAAPGEGEGES